MRNLKATGDDAATMKLLKEGAEAAANASTTDKKIAQLSDQVRMLQYALANVFKTLATYPQVKEQIDQLDYRTLGIARALEASTPGFDEQVEKHAREAKIDAFQELSDDDDVQRNLIGADDQALTEDHVVIFTSSCEAQPERGAFRSKMDVGGPEVAPFKESILGKKVGEVVTASIEGLEHKITILGVRKKPDASSEK